MTTGPGGDVLRSPGPADPPPPPPDAHGADEHDRHPAHRGRHGLPERRSLRSRLLENPWYLKFLAAVGAVSIVGGVLALFAGTGRRPPQAWVAHYPRVDAPEFLASLSGLTGAAVRTGGTARLLENGDEFYPALVAALRSARHSIDFSCYIWEDGAASALVLGTLHEALGRRVQVRVLLDGFGGVSAPEGDMDALRAAGAQVVSFRAPRFGKLTRLHKRNHRRAIVVDGRVAFTGGMAVGDKWLGDAQSEAHWRDTMVEVTGPPALSVQTAFADEWAYVTGEMLAGPAFFPLLPEDPGPAAMRTLGVASAPSATDDHPLRLMFVRTFSAARERLWIQSPYFVPDPSLRHVVESRARAGVDVRVLLPDDHTDAPMVRLTSRYHYAELLAAGVRVYEYGGTMNHAKHVVVDGAFTVVGSANMDIRSLELNHDNVLGVLDRSLATAVERAFLEDLGRAREIRPEEWPHRGRWERALERAASLLSEQY